MLEEEKGKELERRYSEKVVKNYVMSLEYIEEEIKRKWLKYWKWNGEMKMGYRKYIWEGDMNLLEIRLDELDEMEEMLKSCVPNVGQGAVVCADCYNHG